MKTRGLALEVARIAGHIGAEITGVDLAAELSEEVVAGIRAALLEHQVLVFRDQRLDHGQQVAFGRRFGELTARSRPQHGGELEEFPEILTISPGIDRDLFGLDVEAFYRTRWASPLSGWHTDMSHAVDPPAGAILRAEVVPDFGGDTQWTSLTAAYQGLSEPLRDLVDGLEAEHSFFAGYRMVPGEELDRRVMRMLAADERVALHPVVRVHPETGERALFVNPSRTSRIAGLSPAESGRLLDMLFEHAVRAEYTVRVRWEPGMVVFWDNRSTAHIAATDAAVSGQARVLYRVTLAGDRPVGPTGFVSRPLLGAPMGMPS
ncbi:TauD/TfdA dioxygenase family protein [Actinomadura harenae]|uniref:TauD/TfdA family dioxygenase n=1 Tax=Actinomadura harenae TaxID=2483351 RepID=A0A3M2LWZ8_9ACTN|nr:TauD/TfdA family dioxygenase [Actinomadura harenae]RMI42094.1 TauD/TfdA family dioxygenase [Actinomadura harenae]